jgi:hemoglobin
MTKTAIQALGGEDGLRTLVEHFYDLIETLPEGAKIQSLHFQGHGIAQTRIEQFNFLSGFCGGRQYYLEKHRHMNVKEIHAHVPIETKDAEDWLTVMDRALGDLGHEGKEIDRLRQTLRRVALILVNHGEVAGA